MLVFQPHLNRRWQVCSRGQSIGAFWTGLGDFRSPKDGMEENPVCILLAGGRERECKRAQSALLHRVWGLPKTICHSPFIFDSRRTNSTYRQVVIKQVHVLGIPDVACGFPRLFAVVIFRKQWFCLGQISLADWVEILGEGPARNYQDFFYLLLTFGPWTFQMLLRRPRGLYL